MDWMIERGFKPIRATLREVVPEAPGVKSFYFDYDKEHLQYRASQVFHLHVNFQEEGDMYRPFSIASSPTEDFLLFTMKIRPDSVYRAFLDSIMPGEELIVLGPVGRFTLPEDPSKHVVFLGDGIGITPFRSMAKFAADQHLTHHITLLYSSRTPEDIIFRKDWDELAKKNPNFSATHTIKEPLRSGDNWDGRVGKIDDVLIREHVKDLSRAVFYLCGEPKIVREFGGLLRGLGVMSSQVNVDVFFGYD